MCGCVEVKRRCVDLKGAPKGWRRGGLCSIFFFRKNEIDVVWISRKLSRGREEPRHTRLWSRYVDVLGCRGVNVCFNTFFFAKMKKLNVDLKETFKKNQDEPRRTRNFRWNEEASMFASTPSFSQKWRNSMWISRKLSKRIEMSPDTQGFWSGCVGLKRLFKRSRWKAGGWCVCVDKVDLVFHLKYICTDPICVVELRFASPTLAPKM